nr:hypothetical protein [Tanacetum cinerariifolium]
SIVETDKVIHNVEIDIVKLMVKNKSFLMNSDEFDKETGSSDGLQPKQVDLSCIHALNELNLHEICVVPRVNLEYFRGLITPFSSIVGQMGGPFLTDSRVIRGRLSAPKRIALSERVVIEKVFPLIPMFIASDGILIVSSSRIPVIPCQMANFLAVHALCCAWAIMVKLALVAQWKSSSILFPFTNPNGVKDKQENVEIESKPGKNGKRGEAGRSQK